MWIEALLWAPHQHPGGTTDIVSFTEMCLSLGLASLHSLQHTPIFLAFRTSCQGHLLDRVEEKGPGYCALEYYDKGHAWMISILYWQLGIKDYFLPSRTAGTISDCKQLCHQKTWLRLTRYLISNSFPWQLKLILSTLNSAEIRFAKGLTLKPSRYYTPILIEFSVCWAVYCTAPTHNTEQRNKSATSCVHQDQKDILMTASVPEKKLTLWLAKQFHHYFSSKLSIHWPQVIKA